MSPDQLLWLYLLLALGGLGGVAALDVLRRKRFDPEPTSDHVFRCARCAMVYTDDADVALSRCPQCSEMNEPMRF
jgi:hypothetical protein